MVAAGASHTVALHEGGTVRAWGNDDFGQLGLGRLVASSGPNRIPGVTTKAGAGSIAAGMNHVLSLQADGTVLAWGGNFTGSLGDGTTIDRPTPVRVTGLQRITAVAANMRQSLALDAEGDVWAWGGDGLQGFRPDAIRVDGIASVVAIACGEEHTVAVKNDGSVWTWGRNGSGQLGDGTTQTRTAPTQVVGVSGVIAIAAGLGHTLALKSDGTVWSWGANESGQLGDGTTNSSVTPRQVPGVVGVTRIGIGRQTSFAVRSDGTAWAWGSNLQPRPMLVGGVPVAADMKGGPMFALVGGDGSVWTWGTSDASWLGHPVGANPMVPARVPGLPAIAALATGSSFTIAVAADGGTYSWGANERGQLGIAQQLSRTAPSQVVGVVGVRQVAAGGRHSLALRDDGTVWAWGQTTISAGSSSAGIVGGLANVVQLSAGGSDAGGQSSAAVRSNGALYTWGDNTQGQLGRPAEGSSASLVPAAVALSDVRRVSAGASHMLAVRGDGTVWAWGANQSGQLGPASPDFCGGPNVPCARNPIQVPGLTGTVAVAAGGAHSLALRSDGTVWAWGDNSQGQLGDGTTANRAVPAMVPGLPPIAEIAAGGGAFTCQDVSSAPDGHSVARANDGSVWTWGANLSGAVGDGSYARRQVPRPVAGISNAISISAGGRHTAIVGADGTVLTFGCSEYGQLGDGTVASRSAPVVVLRENGAGSIDANDWFLDLKPSVSGTVATDRSPRFGVLASGRAGGAAVTVTASLQFRTQDVGTDGGVFVFALAPATLVTSGQAASAFKVGVAKDERKADTPVPCVLAQLNSAGQMTAVTSANLSAYLSGVLGSQGASVSILNNVSTPNVAGATFFVGYGPDGGTMIDSGVNRAAVTVPGSLTCIPRAPQTGWWWNPLEDGRGFSLEVRGNNMFFAAFLYDVSGRSTWYVSTGPASLEGSYYTGPLYSAAGGQTLGGPYSRFPTLTDLGTATLAFNNESTGTLVWPGGTVPIQRFNIIPNGLNLPAVAGQPESGWWWNEQENGRGFFMEWQNGWLDIAGYMYDDNGDSVWYLTVGEIGGTASARSFSGNWWSYGDGMTLAGPWRQHRQTSNSVAPVTITFSGPDTALMTLPNGRTTNLKRHRF
jgi:alpha-tubulin suppressor-like RCC1 family protein